MFFRGSLGVQRGIFKGSSVRLVNFRSIHNVPTLANDNVWSKNGIPGLYSQQGYQLAWNDYQSFLATNLTLLTAGTDLEQQNAFHTMITTSGINHQASTFHYASQLYNNHFYFSSLVQNPVDNTTVPNRELLKKINASFGSLELLKEQFVAAGTNQLANNGWIFLVENINKDLEIKVINNEGTPHAYFRNQSISLSSPVSLSEYSTMVKYSTDLTNNVQDWSLPLLGVSVWDYAYLLDYGVDKKQGYLENVWKAIDWDVINRRVFVAH